MATTLRQGSRSHTPKTRHGPAVAPGPRYTPAQPSDGDTETRIHFAGVLPSHMKEFVMGVCIASLVMKQSLSRHQRMSFLRRASYMHAGRRRGWLATNMASLLEHARLPEVAVAQITMNGGELDAYVVGERLPRRLVGLSGVLRLSRCGLNTTQIASVACCSRTGRCLPSHAKRGGST